MKRGFHLQRAAAPNRARTRVPFFANFGGPSSPCTVGTLLAGGEGAVTVLFAVTASMMIGTLCTAIDTIDFAQTQARMQMALDVATLSAGADLSHFKTNTGSDLTTWQADARAYYDANMPTGYMALTMAKANFSATVTGSPATGQTIKLSASGQVPLYAPTFLTNNSSDGSGSGGGDSGSGSPTSQTISASNTALRVPKSTLELALILDNTGSMADAAASGSTTSKMDGLKSAASSLVTNILGVADNDSYIGLVPFTTMVNVGSALNSSGSWMSQVYSKQFAYNTNGMSMTQWGGCTVEPHDANGYIYPKAYMPKYAPGFTPMYYNVPPAGFTVSTFDNAKSCTLQTSKTFYGVPLTYQTNASASVCPSAAATQPQSYMGQVTTKSTATYSWDQNGSDVGGNRPCSIQPAVFLTQDTDKLKVAINNMQANGSTLIPTGLLWGWRMLKSDWSQDVAGTNNGWKSTDTTLPRPETNQGLQRVAIILTDGENAPGSTSGMMPPPYFNQLSGVGSLLLQAPTVARSDGTWLDGNVSSTTDVNTFQSGVCTAMKNDGIIIYAITFGSGSSSSTAQKAMQSCATAGNYYHAPDNATLNQIFQQIAGNLGVLRLVQ